MRMKEETQQHMKELVDKLRDARSLLLRTCLMGHEDKLEELRALEDDIDQFPRMMERIMADIDPDGYSGEVPQE